MLYSRWAWGRSNFQCVWHDISYVYVCMYVYIYTYEYISICVSHITTEHGVEAMFHLGDMYKYVYITYWDQYTCM